MKVHLKVYFSTTKERKTFYAVWEEPTVSLWDRVTERADDGFVNARLMEERAWKYLLISSNLSPSLLRPSRPLNSTLLSSVLNFTPAFIPSKLVTPLLVSVNISADEEFRIKRECDRLFSSVTAEVLNPHPLLDSAIRAMSMKERYAIPAYRDIGSMPQRLYNAFKIVSITYSVLQDQEEKRRDLRWRAVELAKGHRPEG